MYWQHWPNQQAASLLSFCNFPKNCYFWVIISVLQIFLTTTNIFFLSWGVPILFMYKNVCFCPQISDRCWSDNFRQFSWKYIQVLGLGLEGFSWISTRMDSDNQEKGTYHIFIFIAFDKSRSRLTYIVIIRPCCDDAHVTIWIWIDFCDINYFKELCYEFPLYWNISNY